MADGQCVFCQIAAKEKPSEIEYEDDEFIAFRDIKPSASAHLLIVPKKHLRWQDDLTQEAALLGRIFKIAPVVARKTEVFDDGFKLMMNCGKGAGQMIEHFHMHLLGEVRG